MTEGIAAPCPHCGHHTLFYPDSPTYPTFGVIDGRGIGCCNPMCVQNSGDDDDEEYDDD